MSMSKVPSRGEPESCIIPIRTLGAELSEAVSSIWPEAHKGAKGNGFGGYMGKDIKRMGRDDVREVRDHSNAVPGIRSLVGRCVNRRGSKRKSRGRFRT
jgi:hypothetical protein